MKALHMVTYLLLIVGGLNWLLVGAFGWDIGSFLGGMDSAASRAIYVLVGLSAIWSLINHKKDCMHCSAGSSSGMM